MAAQIKMAMNIKKKEKTRCSKMDLEVSSLNQLTNKKIFLLEILVSRK